MWWCNRAEQDCTAAVALYYTCKKCILNSGLAAHLNSYCGTWDERWCHWMLILAITSLGISLLLAILCVLHILIERKPQIRIWNFVPLRNILFTFVIALFGLICFSILYNSVYRENVDFWILSLNSAKWNWGWDIYLNTWYAKEVFCRTHPNVILHFSPIFD